METLTVTHSRHHKYSLTKVGYQFPPYMFYKEFTKRFTHRSQTL